MNLRSRKVFVAQTGKTGLGLFARRDIRQGEILFIVKGRLVEDSYNENYEDLPYSLAVEKHIWLDPFETNPWRYINHSCAPNAGIRGSVTVVAMRDIRGGATKSPSITRPRRAIRCGA